MTEGCRLGHYNTRPECLFGSEISPKGRVFLYVSFMPLVEHLVMCICLLVSVLFQINVSLLSFILFLGIIYI